MDPLPDDDPLDVSQLVTDPVCLTLSPPSHCATPRRFLTDSEEQADVLNALYGTEFDAESGTELEPFRAATGEQRYLWERIKQKLPHLPTEGSTALTRDRTTTRSKSLSATTMLETLKPHFLTNSDLEGFLSTIPDGRRLLAEEKDARAASFGNRGTTSDKSIDATFYGGGGYHGGEQVRVVFCR